LRATYVASGEVKYVTKHFPLESECNPYANAGHQASCEASAAVIMSRGKGTTEKLEDWIFGHLGPPLLTPAEVKDAARTVGGITDFDAQYPRALEEIKADAALGNQLKVQTTPTYYINGKKPGMLAPQYFDALIQLELQRSK
jgi:protein-disulfide isomerase